MKVKEIICSYCKKKPKEKVDCMPTWFGEYRGEELLEVICIDCYQKNEEEWLKIK